MHWQYKLSIYWYNLIPHLGNIIYWLNYIFQISKRMYKPQILLIWFPRTLVSIKISHLVLFHFFSYCCFLYFYSFVAHLFFILSLWSISKYHAYRSRKRVSLPRLIYLRHSSIPQEHVQSHSPTVVVIVPSHGVVANVNGLNWQT